MGEREKEREQARRGGGREMLGRCWKGNIGSQVGCGKEEGGRERNPKEGCGKEAHL